MPCKGRVEDTLKFAGFFVVGYFLSFFLNEDKYFVYLKKATHADSSI